jgi:N,N-dimethylformamidase
MAFGETPAGGALFATSSIAWCGSLSHNAYDNNVSRITWNVLQRFMEDTPFPVR